LSQIELKLEFSSCWLESTENVHYVKTYVGDTDKHLNSAYMKSQIIN